MDAPSVSSVKNCETNRNRKQIREETVSKLPGKQETETVDEASTEQKDLAQSGQKGGATTWPLSALL